MSDSTFQGEGWDCVLFQRYMCHWMKIIYAISSKSVSSLFLCFCQRVPRPCLSPALRARRPNGDGTGTPEPPPDAQRQAPVWGSGHSGQGWGGQGRRRRGPRAAALPVPSRGAGSTAASLETTGRAETRAAEGGGWAALSTARARPVRTPRALPEPQAPGWCWVHVLGRRGLRRGCARVCGGCDVCA